MKPEKVKIFCSTNYAELEDDYNSWMEENDNMIEVIERKIHVDGPIPVYKGSGEGLTQVEAFIEQITLFYREK